MSNVARTLSEIGDATQRELRSIGRTMARIGAWADPFGSVVVGFAFIGLAVLVVASLLPYLIVGLALAVGLVVAVMTAGVALGLVLAVARRVLDGLGVRK